MLIKLWEIYLYKTSGLKLNPVLQGIIDYSMTCKFAGN